jgi:hypothetical protein
MSENFVSLTSYLVEFALHSFSVGLGCIITDKGRQKIPPFTYRRASFTHKTSAKCYLGGKNGKDRKLRYRGEKCSIWCFGYS